MAALPPSAPVRESLEAASRELARIADLGRAMQDRLGPLLRRGDEAAFEAQALDEMVQHAQGLQAFLDALGRACEDDWRVSPRHAAAGLGLAAQHGRLAGPAAPPSQSPATPARASGELELF